MIILMGNHRFSGIMSIVNHAAAAQSQMNLNADVGGRLLLGGEEEEEGRRNFILLLVFSGDSSTHRGME